MSVLLVQSCSKSKRDADEAVPPLELYSGYFFKIINKAIREGDFEKQIDLCILSAEHGIVPQNSRISWYDRRMTQARAEELAPDVKKELHDYLDGAYDDVVINVGGVYRDALQEFVETADCNIYFIEGGGIGEKGHVLKKFIRGDIQTTNAHLKEVGA